MNDLRVITPRPGGAASSFAVGPGGAITTGAEKLSQQLAVALNTLRGSNMADLSYGVSTAINAGNFNLGDGSQLAAAFRQNISDVVSWFLQNQPASLPTTERLVSATYEGLLPSNNGTGVVALFSFINASGTVGQVSTNL